MSRNDVLGVGAASSLILFSGAWLTGYWDNRLVAWLALLGVISGASAIAWFTKSNRSNYQDLAKAAAINGAIIYVVACIFGLIATRWAHGTWSPELYSYTDGILYKLFNRFPGDLMKTILHPNFNTVVFGSVLIAIWSALGSSFLPIKDNSKSKKRKDGK